MPCGVATSAYTKDAVRLRSLDGQGPSDWLRTRSSPLGTRPERRTLQDGPGVRRARGTAAEGEGVGGGDDGPGPRPAAVDADIEASHAAIVPPRGRLSAFHSVTERVSNGS